jgi:hypothetical protein
MYNQTELGNAITTSIAIMASEHSPELHQLLAESGNSVDMSKSTDELLEAALKALKNSSSFRNGLATYLSEEARKSDANYGNYVEDSFFNNFTNPFDNYSNVGNFVGKTIGTMAHKGSIVQLKAGSNYKGFSGDNNFFNFVDDVNFSGSRKQIFLKK